MAIWKVFHESAKLHVVALGLLQESVSNLVRPIFGCRRNLPRVRARDLDRGNRLADDEEVLDLADEVVRRAIVGNATKG